MYERRSADRVIPFRGHKKTSASRSGLESQNWYGSLLPCRGYKVVVQLSSFQATLHRSTSPPSATLDQQGWSATPKTLNQKMGRKLTKLNNIPGGKKSPTASPRDHLVRSDTIGCGVWLNPCASLQYPCHPLAPYLVKFDAGMEDA